MTTALPAVEGSQGLGRPFGRVLPFREPLILARQCPNCYELDTSSSAATYGLGIRPNRPNRIFKDTTATARKPSPTLFDSHLSFKGHHLDHYKLPLRQWSCFEWPGHTSALKFEAAFFHCKLLIVGWFELAAPFLYYARH